MGEWWQWGIGVIALVQALPCLVAGGVLSAMAVVVVVILALDAFDVARRRLEAWTRERRKR